MSLIKKAIISIFDNPIMRGISKVDSIRKLAFRYVGSEQVDDIFIQKMQNLINQGYRITISLLGEQYNNSEKVQKYIQNLNEIINKVSMLNNISISVKLSALGILLEENICKQNLKNILDSCNNRIHIDMENSVLIDSTLNIFDFFRKELKYNNLDITFQAYLYRTMKDIDDRILSFDWDSKPIVRLCKGAYKEPFDKILPSKSKIDENYYNIAVKLLDNISKVYPAFATHDHKLIEKIKNYCQYKGISRDDFEFQMLYGVRQDLQKKIIEQGYNLRIYIPVGSEWYEYFVRRLAEKPSNLLLLFYSLVKYEK
ncbi:MAG: proline dehydrogenase family protein [bacterium]